MLKKRHRAPGRRYLIALAATSVVVASVVAAGPAATAKPATPVLGIKGLMLHGSGWGRARPRNLHNGGVPSGSIQAIRWRGWGDPTARGTGRHPTYRPEGGYYKSLGVIQLKASRLGTCAGAPGKRAYTRLVARSQIRPRGPFGDWYPWTLDLCDFDAEPQKCESVSFAPNTDFGAFEITAWDTDCATAQEVAAASRNIAIKPGNARYRLRARDFVCRGYSFDGDGLPSITWNCSRNTAVVSFQRS